jgi:hypothetical protein
MVLTEFWKYVWKWTGRRMITDLMKSDGSNDLMTSNGSKNTSLEIWFINSMKNLVVRIRRKFDLVVTL